MDWKDKFSKKEEKECIRQSHIPAQTKRAIEAQKETLMRARLATISNQEYRITVLYALDGV
eukprot:7234854-Heterocapsa_arctica.AAC.1